jgi:uncharacterized membrane protein
VALTLSFIIAAMFWFSHHRRIAFAPEAGRGAVFLNLPFLLSIIVLRATNGLYGSYQTSTVVAVIYSGHPTVIAALNALLWVIALAEFVPPGILTEGTFAPTEPIPVVISRNSCLLFGTAVHVAA